MSTAEELPLFARHTIVCVDDDFATLRALERLLRPEPYDVITTQDPEEAIGWVRTGLVSLLVADQRMPLGTGVELVEEARRRAPATACMILTGHPSGELAEEARRAGSRWLVTKPWNPDAFRRAVREALYDRELEECLREADRAPEEDAASEDHRPLVHIDCAGRCIRDVMRELEPMLEDPQAAGGVTVVLDRLLELEGSLWVFFIDLVHRARAAGVGLTVEDRTGYARMILGVIGGPLPVVAKPAR